MQLLRAGIQRWQMRTIQAHVPDFPGGCELWPRGIRALVGSKGAALRTAKSAGIVILGGLKTDCTRL
eukprot:4792508-Pyramimonas_sp.AAC.1